MGYKVRELRKKKRMSQAELAEKSGVSRATIIAIEKDDNKIVSSATLVKLATALGTTVERIFFQKRV